MSIITYLFICFLLPFSALAQDQIKGKVFDTYSKAPLEGASVKLSAAIGTTTDKKGEFVLVIKSLLRF